MTALEAIDNELARLHEKLREYELLKQRWEALQKARSLLSGEQTAAGGTRWPKGVTVNAIKEVLAGGPLPVQQIIRRSGRHKTTVLACLRDHPKEFVRISRGYYGLATAVATNGVA